MLFTVGTKIVPLHALCGEWQQIMVDGKKYVIIVGTPAKAEAVCSLLNASQRGQSQ